jgi:hypothetical protein
MAIGEREILAFQIQRACSNLSKNMLIILEDLQQELDRRVQGSANYPDDFLDEKHFNHLRKRILDKSGDAVRDLQEELEKYHVRLLTNEELQSQAREAQR